MRISSLTILAAGAAPLGGAHAAFLPSHQPGVARFAPTKVRAPRSIAIERSMASTHADDAEMAVEGDGADSSARRARILGPLSAAALATATAAGALSPPSSSSSSSSCSLCPQPVNAAGETFESSLRAYFPGAVSNTQLASRIVGTLRQRGFNPDNTLFGASLCSDEVNDTPLSLFSQLQDGLTKGSAGGVFNLGGLGGVPFVGPSGFGAFFSHCPASGKVLIMYGPHVGISSDGIVGKVERVGMDKKSGACGAALGAYKAIKAEKAKAEKFSVPSNQYPGLPYTDAEAGDVQEDYIIRELRKKLENDDLGGEDENALIALVTNRMYDMVSELMYREVDAKMKSGSFFEGISEVALLGGIVVNRGNARAVRSVEDYFKPVTFQAMGKSGEVVNLFDTLYDESFDSKAAIFEPQLTAEQTNILVTGATAATLIGGGSALVRGRSAQDEKAAPAAAAAPAAPAAPTAPTKPKVAFGFEPSVQPPPPPALVQPPAAARPLPPPPVPMPAPAYAAAPLAPAPMPAPAAFVAPPPPPATRLVPVPIPRAPVAAASGPGLSRLSQGGEELDWAVSSLINELLVTALASDRGQFASPSQRGAASSLVSELEAVSPVADPTNSARMDGTWELLYADAPLFRSSPFFMAGRAACRTDEDLGKFDAFCRARQVALSVGSVGKIRQVVGGGRLVSEFEVQVGGTVGGSIVSTADVAPTADGRAWEVSFDAVELRGSNVPVLGQLLDLEVGSGFFREVADAVGGTATAVYYTTYLDDSLRISRDQDGKVYVFGKVSGDVEATDYSSVAADLSAAKLMVN